VYFSNEHEFSSRIQFTRHCIKSVFVETNQVVDSDSNGVVQCVSPQVAVCCSVLQCVAVWCSVSRLKLQCVAMCCSVLQCVAVWCGVSRLKLQCVAVCCSVLQCVAVWCSGSRLKMLIVIQTCH